MEKQTYQVLIIEDEDLDYELVHRMLASKESASHDVAFHVTWVKYLREGLQRLLDEQFDIVLLDLRLPDSVGIATLEKLLIQSPRAVVVVLTGTEDESTAIQAARQGAHDYLNKNTLTAAQLVRSVLYAIERQKRLTAERKLRVTAREYAAAGAVQRLLLPNSAPKIAGLDIAGGCWPFEHVGGDYYDYFEMRDGRLGLAIADVSGHGLAAALVMAGLRRLFRSCTEVHSDVGEIMTLANLAAVSDTYDHQFITAFLAILDPETRELTHVGAGHECYVIEPSGSTRSLQGKNIPLGVVDNGRMHPGEPTKLAKGEILFLMTDGVYESRNQDGEVMGVAPLLRKIHEHRERTAEEIIGVVCEFVLEYCKPNPAGDDMAIVVVKSL